MLKIPNLYLHGCSIVIKDEQGNEIFSADTLDGHVELQFKDGMPHKDQESAGLKIDGNVKFFCIGYPL